MAQERESVKVLRECIDLQIRKSQDYQNPNSNIVQAMHYRRGVSTIHDMINQKLLRAQSLLEPLENGEGVNPNFESLEDTYKDLINYASFAVSYLRFQMEGQQGDRDILNRPIYRLPPELKQEGINGQSRVYSPNQLEVPLGPIDWRDTGSVSGMTFEDYKSAKD